MFLVGRLLTYGVSIAGTCLLTYGLSSEDNGDLAFIGGIVLAAGFVVFCIFVGKDDD